MRRAFLAAGAVLLASLAATADDPGPAAKKTTSSVSAVVADESGRPIAGARVEAYPVRPPKGGAESPFDGPFARDDAREATWDEMLDPARKPRVPEATSTTDAAGGACVEGLSSGLCAIVVAKPGFAVRRRVVSVPATDAPVRFALLAGHPVEGRATLPDGRPLAGAPVVASYDGHDDFFGVFGPPATRVSPFDPWTRTDAQGRWRLDALPEGEVEIHAAPPGTWTSHVGRIRVPAVERFDFVIDARGPLAGTVRDTVTREPVAGAVVEAETAGWHTAHVRARAVADAHGRYSIPLYPSNWIAALTARAKGFAPIAARPGNGAAVEFSECSGVEKDVFLARAAAAPEPPDVAPAVEPRPAAQETIVVRGVVRPAEGETLVAGRVLALRFGGADPLYVDARREAWTPTAADGRFELTMPAWPRDKLGIAAAADGYAVTVVESADLEVDVRLRTGADVRGRVTDEDDEPIAGAHVSIGRPSQGGISCREDEDPDPPVFATSAPDGTFVLPHVPSGKLRIEVSAPGVVSTTRNVDLADGAAADAEFALPRPTEIRGVVTWPDGSPIADVDIEAHVPFKYPYDPQPCQTGRATTDAQGQFVVRGLRPGRYTVAADPGPLADPPKHDFVSTWVDGVDAACDDVSIVVRRAGRISGRVVDQAGHAVAAASVEANPSKEDSRDPSRDTRTDDDGRFELRALGDGAYSLTVHAKGHDVGCVERVRAGDADVTVELPDGLSIEGVLVGAAGDPLPGRVVAAFSRGNRDELRVRNAVARCAPDAAGRFVLPGLESGRHVIAVFAPDADDAEPTLASPRFADAGARDLRVVALADKVIAGEVVETSCVEGMSPADERPLRGVTVRLTSAGRAEPIEARTDAEGAFQVGGLAEGESFTIEVSAKDCDMEPMEPVVVGSTDVRVELHHRTAEVRGRIVDASGKPLRDLGVQMVERSNPGHSISMNTLDGWKFSRDGVRVGDEYDVFVLPHAGGLLASLGTKIHVGRTRAGDEEKDFILDVPKRTLVAGAVVDEKGVGLAEWRVIARRLGPGDAHERLAAMTSTQPDGTFAIESIAPCRVTVDVYGPDGARRTIAPWLFDAGTTDARIAVVPGPTVFGRVVGESDADVADTPVQLVGAADGREWTTRIDASGAFLFRDLGAAQKYEIRARRDGFLPLRRFDLVTGDPDLEIVLRRPFHRLAGQALDAAGAPLRSGKLRFVPSDGADDVETSTDSEGKFETTGARDVDYVAFALIRDKDGALAPGDKLGRCHGGTKDLVLRPKR